MKTAILVDGGFYTRRAQKVFGDISAKEQAYYTIRPNIVKKLCNGSLTFADLTEADFCVEIDQKGVDMKIGLDIASSL